MLESATMSGRVGEIVFTGHYTGPMDVAALHKAPSGRFGSPQKTGSEHGATPRQWQQWVTAARSDKFDTQGWPGVCDMVHVALVQGNCMPVGSRTSVTAFLVANSTALIGTIEGTLSCGGDDGGRPGGGGSFCDSHPNNRKCQ